MFTALGGSGAEWRSAEVTWPVFEAIGFDKAPVELPMFDAFGTEGTNGSSVVTWPKWLASGAPGAAVDWPMFLATGSGATGGLGFSYVRPLELWAAAGFGHSGDMATLGGSSVSLPIWTVRGAGTSGSIGSSDVVLPLFEASGTGYLSTSGASSVAWPVWIAEGYGSESIAVTYTGLALNLRRQRMTTLAGWRINSMAAFGDRMIGATDDALLELTGDDDDGVPIDARIETGAGELGTEKLKRMHDVLVSYRTDGDLRFTAQTETAEADYVMEAHGHVGELAPGRVKIGKGLDGRYWTFSVENIDGASLELGAMTAAGHGLSRRLR